MRRLPAGYISRHVEHGFHPIGQELSSSLPRLALSPPALSNSPAVDSTIEASLSVASSDGATWGPVYFVALLFFAAFPPLTEPPFLPTFLVDFFAAPFFAAFLVPPFLPAFFAAFLVDRLAAPPRPFFPALFFVPFRPALRAPLDFLLPFLAAISFAPLVGLILAHRSKINSHCPRCFYR